MRRQPERELDADDARGADGLPFVRGELFELTGNCSDEACRDRGFERVGRQLEPPAVRALDDMSFSQQVLDGRDQKERVAACEPVKRR